jgi:uncharacterized membrane protein
MTGSQLASVLMVLCLIGIILALLANQWQESRRMKIAVVLLLVCYLALYGLR